MVGSVTSKAEIRLKVNVSRDLTRMGIKKANGISLASFRSFHVRARSFALRSACLEERLQRRLHPCSGLHQSSFLLLCLGVPECFLGFSQAGIGTHKIMAGGKCHAPSLVACVTADSESDASNLP